MDTLKNGVNNCHIDGLDNVLNNLNDYLFKTMEQYLTLKRFKDYSRDWYNSDLEKFRRIIRRCYRRYKKYKIENDGKWYQFLRKIYKREIDNRKKVFWINFTQKINQGNVWSKIKAMRFNKALIDPGKLVDPVNGKEVSSAVEKGAILLKYMLVNDTQDDVNQNIQNYRISHNWNHDYQYFSFERMCKLVKRSSDKEDDRT